MNCEDIAEMQIKSAKENYQNKKTDLVSLAVSINARNKQQKDIEEFHNIKRSIDMSKKYGIYYIRPDEKTPNWVKLKLGIKLEDFQKIKPNKNGFINIDICLSKDGSLLYPKLNEFGIILPDTEADINTEIIGEEEIPF